MSATSLLKTRRFLPYFVTQFGGAFNDSLVRRGVEMLITFKGLSGEWAPETAIFTLLALFMAPFFIFSAFAGYLADTASKEKIIRYIKSAEVLIVLIGAWGLVSHSLILCVISVVGLGVHSAFFGPVKFSLPPQHLQEEELIAANGLIEAGTNIAILLGTVLGSALIGFSGGEFGIATLAVLASLAGLSSSMFIPPAPAASGASFARKGTWSLLRRLVKEKTLFLLTLGISWFWTLGAILISLFSLISKDLLGTPELCVTAFFAIFSVGIGVGSLLCNKILKGEIAATWVPLAAIGMGLSLFSFYFLLPASAQGATSTLEFFSTFRGITISFFLFTLSVSAGIFIVPLYGLLQRATSSNERSQIIAANNILNALLMVVGSLSLTFLFQLGTSVSSALLILSAINIVVAIFACLLLPDTLIKSILRVIFKSFFRARVTGLANFSKVGPRALIIANHLSFLDAVMLAAFLPDRATFAVDTGISKLWWMRPAMSCFDMIAIDPTNPMAIRILIDRLKENRKVVIFPEGRITVTGALMKVYEGPAMIADRADAELVPIRLEGFQYTIFSRVTSILKWKLFPQLSMHVCEPTRLTIPSECRGRARREQLSLALHDLMTNLIYTTNERGPTLLHAVRRAATLVGTSKIIAKDPLGGKVSLGSLLQKSYVLSRVISQISLPDPRIGLLLPSGIPLLLFFFAVQWKKRTPALLNYSHSPEQIEATCRIAGFRTLITSRKFVAIAKLEPHLQRIIELGIVVVYLEDILPTISLFDKIKALLCLSFQKTKAHFGGEDFIPGSENDEGVVLFTSGSEGTPKGVVLSHKNLLNNVDQVTATVPLKATDKVFNALPMFHSFGLTGGTLMPITKGVPVVLYPSPLHYRIIPGVVYNESATILFGTPTFLAGYAKKAHPYDFFTIRYVFSGAERLSDAVRNTYNDRFGLRIFEGYGTTETSPVLAVNSPFYTKKGTVGRFVPGIKYRLETIPGIPEGGRLFVQGPNVMKGYLKLEKPGVLQPLEDDWYDTGDIVSVDTLGFITIKGRAKRFAKIGGEMVSLTAIEQALDAEWPKFLHCVVSIPDVRKGEKLILVTSNPEATREGIFEALKSKGLPELSIPREIKVRSTLPLLGSGKIDVQSVIKELTL